MSGIVSDVPMQTSDLPLHAQCAVSGIVCNVPMQMLDLPLHARFAINIVNDPLETHAFCLKVC